MPGPTAKTTASWPCARCPGERRSSGHELGVGVEARRDGAGDLDQAALPKRPHRVRERDRQRAAGNLDVDDPHAGQPSAYRRHLAVQRAENDREPCQRFGELVRLLLATDCYLAWRVRQRHHVRALLRRKPEPACQVRVEDVEAARAELEQPRLLVDEHVVAHLDLAGEPWIRDAGDPVDLEPDQPGVALRNRGDRPRLRLIGISGGVDQRQGHLDHCVEVVPPRCARRRCGSPSSRSPGSGTAAPWC